MNPLNFRTKIVATIGPASSSPEVLRQMLLAGMNVARLNFSHGSYEDHGRTVKLLRSLSKELDLPLTILQDLQGPKLRCLGRASVDSRRPAFETSEYHQLPRHSYD